MALVSQLDLGRLRSAIQEEYAEVANHPSKGYHFHVGGSHALRLGYDRAELDRLPDSAALLLESG